MRRRNAGLAVTIFAALVLFAWWLLRTPAPPRVESAPPAAAGASPAPHAAQVQAPAASPLPSRGQAEVPTPAPAPALPSPAIALEDAAATTGAVEGRVLSSASGLGVEGAELTFSRLGAAVVRSGPGGAFRFEPPQPGTWHLAAAQAQGYLPFAPEWGHSPIAVEAVPGRRVRGVTVYLVPAIDYLGVVLDPERRPVAGAEVRVLNARSGEQALLPLQERYTSDAKGEFRFHAPDGSILEARHPAWSPARASLDFSAQVSHRLYLRLGTKASGETERLEIRGTVREVRGPLEGARVIAELEVENRAADRARLASSAEALSEPEGGFLLAGLEPGRYRITATHEGLAPAIAQGVEAGARGVALRLEAGGTLRGTVVEAQSGQPVSAFAVSVWRRPDTLRTEVIAGTMVVEPTGRFELTGLPAGELRVGVSAQGYAFSGEQPVRITPEAPATVQIRLGRGARLAGKVIDRTSRAPVAGARVSVEARALLTGVGSAVQVRPTALTGGDGRFVLTGLAAGPLSLLVAAAGHHGRIVAGLTAPETGDLPEQTVELSPTRADEEPKLELAGVGVVLAPKGDGLVVGTVFPTGGGAAAGLVEGDLVLAVDGRPVKELGFERTIDAIRGPEGTQLVLTVRRADGSTAELTVTRKVVRG